MFRKKAALSLVALALVSILASGAIAAVSSKQEELKEATHIFVHPPMEEVRNEKTNLLLSESRKAAMTKLNTIEGIELERWTMIDLLDSDIYYTNDLPSREAGSFNKMIVDIQKFLLESGDLVPAILLNSDRDQGLIFWEKPNGRYDFVRIFKSKVDNVQLWEMSEKVETM